MGKGSNYRPYNQKKFSENWDKIFSTQQKLALKQIPNFPSYSISKTGKVWSNKSNKFLSPWLNETETEYKKCQNCNGCGYTE